MYRICELPTEAIQQKYVYIMQLRQDNTNLKRHVTELSSEQSRLQYVALTAQEAMLKAMGRGGWAAKEDRVAQDELTKLQEGLRS